MNQETGQRPSTAAVSFHGDRDDRWRHCDDENSIISSFFQRQLTPCTVVFFALAATRMPAARWIDARCRTGIDWWECLRLVTDSRRRVTIIAPNGLRDQMIHINMLIPAFR